MIKPKQYIFHRDRSILVDFGYLCCLQKFRIILIPKFANFFGSGSNLITAGLKKIVIKKTTTCMHIMGCSYNGTTVIQEIFIIM